MITPATEYFDMEMSPGKTTCSIETQTDVTFSITMDMITWTPSLRNVTQKIVDGPDAKLELAINAQQQDIIPEAEPAIYDSESSDDESASDSDAAEEEEKAESDASKSDEDDEEPAIEEEILTPAAGEVRVVEVVQQIEHNIQGKDAETPAPPTSHSETRPEKKKKGKNSKKPLMALDETKRKSRFMPHPKGCNSENCKCEVPATKNAASHAPMMAVDGDKPKPKFLKLRRGITMDTGAHDNVMIARMAGKRRIRPSPGSKRGMSYVAAGNEKIKNVGEG